MQVVPIKTVYFQVGIEEFGVSRAVELKENGSEIPVTNENKEGTSFCAVYLY